LQAALGAIEQATGYPLLKRPLVKEYHPEPGSPIDGKAGEQPIDVHTFSPPTPLGEIERRLLIALQEGLPLFIRPFSVLASRVGCDENEVLERIRRWCAEGVIKRFGVVVRHPKVGYPANAVLVHDIPDEVVCRIGELLAGEPDVTLCYQRPRVPPDWPYNLFCLILGVGREEVAAKIATIRARLTLTDYACDILF
jgi:DNA-binding Lrp family transcriptional regulator